MGTIGKFLYEAFHYSYPNCYLKFILQEYKLAYKSLIDSIISLCVVNITLTFFILLLFHLVFFCCSKQHIRRGFSITTVIMWFASQKFFCFNKTHLQFTDMISTLMILISSCPFVNVTNNVSHNNLIGYQV